MRHVLSFMLLVTLASTAWSQETTATLTGTTTDQTGAVLPGVSVTLKNLATGVTRTVVTNEVGLYVASLLPVGTYQVTFELSGFQPVTIRDVELHVNDRRQIDGRLNVTGVAVSIAVTAPSPLIQPIPALQTT